MRRRITSRLQTLTMGDLVASWQSATDPIYGLPLPSGPRLDRVLRREAKRLTLNGTSKLQSTQRDTLRVKNPHRTKVLSKGQTRVSIMHFCMETDPVTTSFPGCQLHRKANHNPLRRRMSSPHTRILHTKVHRPTSQSRRNRVPIIRPSMEAAAVVVAAVVAVVAVGKAETERAEAAAVMAVVKKQEEVVAVAHQEEVEAAAVVVRAEAAAAGRQAEVEALAVQEEPVAKRINQQQQHRHRFLQQRRPSRPSSSLRQRLRHRWRIRIRDSVANLLLRSPRKLLRPAKRFLS